MLSASGGVCNLSEIDLGKFKGDTSSLYEAAVLLARSNYRQTMVSFDDGILSEEWDKNNEFLHLMGMSVSGVVKRDDMTQYDYRNLRDAISWAGRNMAKELKAPYPKQSTTIKPAGCRVGNESLVTKEGIFTLEELVKDSDNDWDDLNDVNIIQDNGSNNKALKSYKNGLSETVTIKMGYGMETTCTPNHKWMVVRRNVKSGNIGLKSWKPTWVRADEIIPKRDYIDFQLNSFSENNTVYLNKIEQENYNNSQHIITQPEILTEDLAWFFGYLWGDGSLSVSRYRVRFIDENKYKNLEKVKLILKEYFDLDTKIHKASENRNAYVIEIGCKNLWDWIIANEFFKYKNEEKDLANIPLNIRKSKNLILAFIAGMIDSDGCVSKSNNKYTFIISNHCDIFTKHLQEVCWSVGIGIGRSLNTKGRNFQKVKHMWLMANAAYYTDEDSFSIVAKNSVKIATCDESIPWNFEVVRRCSTIVGRVAEITYNEELIDTFDIEVENNHWYLANGGLKSHNTVGKIADTTEGCHRPIAKYLLNNINFSKYDPIVDKLLDAGYTAIDNPSDETGIIVSIPVIFDDVEFDIVEVVRKDGSKEMLEVNNESALDQLARYKMLMTYYCDQNVSITVYYDKSEVPGIIDFVLSNWESYVGISFLPRLDATMSAADLGYSYLPQEVITEEAYNTYISQLKEIDWSDTDNDATEVLEGTDCEGGACPIR